MKCRVICHTFLARQLAVLQLTIARSFSPARSFIHQQNVSCEMTSCFPGSATDLGCQHRATPEWPHLNAFPTPGRVLAFEGSPTKTTVSTCLPTRPAYCKESAPSTLYIASLRNITACNVSRGYSNRDPSMRVAVLNYALFFLLMFCYEELEPRQHCSSASRTDPLNNATKCVGAARADYCIPRFCAKHYDPSLSRTAFTFGKSCNAHFFLLHVRGFTARKKKVSSLGTLA